MFDIVAAGNLFNFLLSLTKMTGASIFRNYRNIFAVQDGVNSGDEATYAFTAFTLIQAPLKVGITGPESTGKSTLSEQLAQHYQTVWVPEYAREYLGKLNRPYTKLDVEEIARGQIYRMQQKMASARHIVFFDTELIVVKIWLLHAYGNCPDWILKAIEQQNFDLYLLLNVDLPWEPDPQREHPHLRQFFYDWYKRELQQYGYPFVEISGSYEARNEQAQKQINLLQDNRLSA